MNKAIALSLFVCLQLSASEPLEPADYEQTPSCFSLCCCSKSFYDHLISFPHSYASIKDSVSQLLYAYNPHPSPLIPAFRIEAQRTFEKILTIWNDNKPFENAKAGAGFWQAANTLDTLVDFLVVTNQKDTFDLTTKAFNFFNDANPNDDWTQWSYWVDDYGWWGVFFIKTYEHAEQLGYSHAEKANLFIYAQNCWNRMHLDWNKDGKGGIRNINNEVDATESRKNSITNLLYGILSSKIHKATTNLLSSHSKYSIAAEDTYKWFTNNNPFNQNKFVLETPNAETSSSHNPEWIWSGDQGAYIGFLQSLNDIKRLSNENILHDFVKNLLMIHNPIFFVDQENIIHEANCKDNFSDKFSIDYSVGIGVLLRYLNHYNRSILERPYAEFLKQNAQAYLKQLQTGVAYPLNWNPQFAPYMRSEANDNSLWHEAALVNGLNVLNGNI